MKAMIRKPVQGFGSMFDVAFSGDGLETELLSVYEWNEAKVTTVKLDREGKGPDSAPDIVIQLRVSGRKATKAGPAR